MGRPCSICTSPHRAEINFDLMAREKTYQQISDQYGVSTYAIRRHVKNHLKPMIQKVDTKKQAVDEAMVLNTLDALDLIIEQLPELVKRGAVNINQALRAVELRARHRGEEEQPDRIIYVWGKGLEVEDGEFDMTQEIVSDLEEFEVVETRDKAEE